MTDKPILVTGATGYVGGRLVPRLLDAGRRVRAVGRSLDKLAARPFAFHPGVELAAADLLDLDSARAALRGCDTAYYLVHSMHPGKRDFAAADRHAALIMARAAREEGLSRIIYLGGLGEDREDLSPHLKSRHEVALILSHGGVPLTHLRAAMILGSGSASFELLRYLGDRLPVMLTPSWVRTRCQPIAITNVLTYLAGCLDEPSTVGRTFDIGGPDILSYEDLFQLYAEQAGLPRRLIIPVPVMSPRLSGYWAQLVTPIPASLVIPLVEGLQNEVVCKDDAIRDIIPQDLRTCRETIARALEKIRQNTVETCCTDAGSTTPPEWLNVGDAPYAGGTVLECGYAARIASTPEDLWRALSRIGGETGWYYGDLLWRLRGFADKLVGGVGLRRLRINPDTLRVGDPLDFWRILTVEKHHRLVLLAEMKLPGEALLEFRLLRTADNVTEMTAHSRFLPRGLAGLAYWYSTFPLHQLVFSGMLTGLAHAAGKPLLGRPQRFTPAMRR
jgi:uncharacterized protein YbjT (DUF2867 family)